MLYIGGEAFGLRWGYELFMEDMKEGVEFVHEHGVKGLCHLEYSGTQLVS